MTRFVPGLAAALLLAACASTSDAPNTNLREAARANVRLGVAYMQQDNLPLAKEKLERAEQQDPRSVEVHTALAFLNERLNRPEVAERHYRTAQRLEPGSADVANNYAVFLCRGGKPDQAIPLFETAARDPLYSTPWAALTNAAVCLRSNKRNADSIPYLQRAVAMRPDYVDGVREFGDALIELGRPAEAVDVAERYLSTGRGSPDVLLIALRASLARGDRAAAENHARRLRRDFPNSAQTRALPQLLPAN